MGQASEQAGASASWGAALIQRRGLLAGMLGLLAAPAVIRSGVLMPISTMIVSSSDIVGWVVGQRQPGAAMHVSALIRRLSIGDIVTVDGVYAVNRVTKRKMDYLRQFVITATAGAGATKMSFYPEMLTTKSQYCTVSRLPLHNAAIRRIADIDTTAFMQAPTRDDIITGYGLVQSKTLRIRLPTDFVTTRNFA